jgi:hypothetical protein
VKPESLPATLAINKIYFQADAGTGPRIKRLNPQGSPCIGSFAE